MNPLHTVAKNESPSVETITIVMLLLLILFTVIGIASAQPTLFLVSFFGLAVTSTTMRKDDTVLNSLSAPFMPLMAIVIMSDSLDGQLATIAFHLPALMFSTRVVLKRKKINFMIMMLASIFYDLWIVMAKLSLQVVYYPCVMGICDMTIQLLVLLVIHHLQCSILSIARSCSEFSRIQDVVALCLDYMIIGSVLTSWLAPFDLMSCLNIIVAVPLRVEVTINPRRFFYTRPLNFLFWLGRLRKPSR
jgi:hypothetical protein